jgi:hypothetical protein
MYVYIHEYIRIYIYLSIYLSIHHYTSSSTLTSPAKQAADSQKFMFQKKVLRSNAQSTPSNPPGFVPSHL